MFKSITIRLTLIYIALLVLICAYFSVNWYRVATNELNRALDRQSSLVELLPNVRGSREFRDILEAREERLIESKRSIARQLLAVNIVLLFVGGLGSYFMAKRTLEPIEKSHKAQARFTADASHELRTPLTAMRTEIEVALRDPQLSKKDAVQLLHSNLEELTTLTKLSDGLLRLARQDAEGEFAMVPTSLRELFKTVRQRTEKQALARDTNISYDVADVYVKAQPEALVELFVNLVDNAIKYSPIGSKVDVSTTLQKHSVTIFVRDNGIGIEPDQQTKIFDRFYRVDASRSKHSGSQNKEVSGHGLGLSIAQQIASSHNTVIHVQSKPGAGSVFSVALPLEPINSVGIV